MATSQGQQQTAQSPFKLFSRSTWTSGKKKAKQANLGEENSMYYHPELKRWVEKGKEEEAEREAAGPPPPPVLSGGSITSAPSHKRSLSQRYVLQPNLSVSSSLASLAGSFSQTDLAALVNGAGADGSFSGPPSALGSTAPSPPQSSNCLASFASGPASTGGLNAPLSPSSFFMPAPAAQRAPSSPQGGFFVPPPPTPEDEAAEAGSSADAPSRSSSRQASLKHHDQEQDLQHDGSDGAHSPSPHPPGNGVVMDAASHADGVSHEVDPSAVPTVLPQPQPAGVAVADGASQAWTSGMALTPPPVHVGEVNGPNGCQDAGPAGDDDGYSVSLADACDQRQLESPVALCSPNAAIEYAAAGLGPGVGVDARAVRMRRLGSGNNGPVGVSDGGAAISLHEGMGVLPAEPSPLGQVDAGFREESAAEVMVEGGEVAAAAVEGQVLAACQQAAGAEGGGGGWPDGGSSGAVDAHASQASAAEADSAATPAGDEASSHYSQYYYQQYAYLHQYALSQGYGEADAVAYAQYYAAAYAQQYEAQAPQGHLGSGGEGTAAEAAGAVGAGDVSAPQEAVQGGAGESASAAFAAGGEAAVAWQVVAAAAEDEASAVVCTGGGVAKGEGGEAAAEQEAAQAEEPVYFVTAAHSTLVAAGGAEVVSAAAPPVPGVPPQSQPVVADGPTHICAAPLPADLTAAATAATQHHQCAVTAAVAAAAAVAASAEAVSRSRGSSEVAAAPLASSTPEPASAVAGPQSFLGLGAAGAKRLTQLSSAATAAVASLGATVAATAAAAAGVRLDATAGGVGGLAGSGLSDDDFERIMHPGDPAKLDGPLPWELPDHLRSGRKFLALCANWQLANPGTAYAPHLLLQPEEGEHGPSEGRQREGEAGAGMLVGGSGDVALAAEGGSGSGGGAASVPQAAHELPPPGVEPLSSYERACRLAQFGEPVAGLVPQVQAGRPQDQAQEQAAAAAEPAVPSGPRPLDVSSLAPVVDSPRSCGQEEPTPRSEDPFAGAEHIPLAQQWLQQPSPLGSPAKPPVPALSLEEELAADEDKEQELSRAEPVQETAVPAAQEETAEPGLEGRCEEEAVSSPPPAAAPLAALGSMEAASFFDHLCEEAGAQAEQEAAGATVPEPLPAAAAVKEMAVVAATEAVAVESEVPHEGAEPAESLQAATVAAAAIDSVVQALEQLRVRATAPACTVGTDGNIAPASNPDSTELLQQIHSSLAQATQALAGMGVDITALASLAGAAQGQMQDQPAVEWTPGPGSKRPRMDGSPSTPTRPVASGASNVVTPLLAPGPPVLRAGAEAGVAESGAPASDSVFQQLGRRLSDASAEAATLSAAGAVAVTLPPPQPVVVSLTVTAAPTPSVDVTAVEERVRSEERAAWEARLAAEVDSEREAAALVIASVEQQRDGLQQRVGELEQQLLAVRAEREALAERLAQAEAGGEQALAAARAEAAAERSELCSRLAAAEAERDVLSGQVAAERAEKAALAEALSSSRAEAEQLRRQYADRFSELTGELEATRGSLAELQSEHDELLLCLGQESTKVAALTDALEEAGGDPEPIIQRIEAEYETMGLGAEGREEGEEEGQEAAEGEAAGEANGWEGAELAL